MGARETRQLRRDFENLKRNDPTLRSLDYDNIQLGNEGPSLLAGALKTNTNLRRLKLGHCNIGPEGLHDLVRSLCEDRLMSSRLRKLELSTSYGHVPQGNPIGDEGAKSLAFLLASSVSLHHLRVSACSIGDNGAVNIARALAQNDSLKTLDLSHNSISDIGAEELGSALKSNSTLKGLLLWSNRVFHTGAEALATGLAANSTLQWLGLGCNHIGDEGVKAIALALLSNAQASSLIWLALGGNGITDKGAEHLAVCLKIQHGLVASLTSRINGDKDNDVPFETSNLTEQIRHGKLRPMLDLGVTPSLVSLHGGSESGDDVDGEIDKQEDSEGETKEARSYCIPLQSLGLGGNKITCLGAGYLADGLKTNTNLLSLGLADNRVSNEGASSFAELIRQTDTLQKITLSGNNIEDEGGSMLMASLSQNTSLQGLYLAGNPCGDAVSKRCQEVVGRHNHTLQTLDLHDTRMSTPAVSDLLSTMRTEKVLHSLGSQPLPLPGAKGHAPIPLTGNMLEMEEWKPQDIHAVMLQKKGRSIAPSQRLITLDVLGSLPEPEETAQTLVVRQSQQVRKGTVKRRGSISQYIKRKLSKKRESTGTSYNVSPSRDARPLSGLRSSKILPGGIELQPLVEEDGLIDGDVVGQGEDEIDGTQDFFRSPTVMLDNVDNDLSGQSTTNEALTPFVITSGLPVSTSMDAPSGTATDTSAITTTASDLSRTTTAPISRTPTASVKGTKAPTASAKGTTTTKAPTASAKGTTTTKAPTASARVTTTTKAPTASARGTTTTTPISKTTTSVKGTTTTKSPTASAKGTTTTAAPISKTIASVKGTTTTKAPTASAKGTTTTKAPTASAKGTTTTTTPISKTTTASVKGTTTTKAPISKTKTTSVPAGTSSASSTMHASSSTAPPTQGSGITTPLTAAISISSTSTASSAVITAEPIIISGIVSSGEVDLNVIPKTFSLGNMTRDRPKPPTQRHPPSRYRTPSPSPTHTAHGEIRLDADIQVERIGGITDAIHNGTHNGTNQRVDNSKNSDAKPGVPIKDQWSTALQKRVGVLKMGGFLHRAFDAIVTSDVGTHHTFTAGRMLCNDLKNHLVAPLPPSHTRVKLQVVPDEIGSDYINASFVGSPTIPKQFIVSQAPIPNTSGDFWRMIWEYRVGVMVVLTKEEEVDSWWPEEGSQQVHSLVVDGGWMDSSLIVSSVEEQVNSANPDLRVHSLTLESLADSETDTVKIFHYANWAQYGVIEKIKDASGLVRHVLRARFSQKYHTSPIAVVSKLGAGRAGCFCALSLAYELMSTAGEPQVPENWKQNINILDQIVLGLRDCRGELVSSQKQFEFCHQALEEVMWGRPASQEELDTWEALNKRKGRKKWKVFGKKVKRDKGMKKRKN